MKRIILVLVAASVSVFGWEPRNAPQPEERALLAAVITAEAGGEGQRGMEAVYEVIWQRAALAHSDYIKVITKPKQFSCLNGVKQADLIKRMSKHKHYEWVRWSLLFHPPLTVHTAHGDKVIRNRSDHYFAHGKVKPSWSNGKGRVIGNHTFEKHR